MVADTIPAFDWDCDKITGRNASDLIQIALDERKEVRVSQIALAVCGIFSFRVPEPSVVAVGDAATGSMSET